MKDLNQRITKAAERRPGWAGVLIGAPFGIALVAFLHVVGLRDLASPVHVLWGALTPGLLPCALIIALVAQFRRGWDEGHRRALTARRGHDPTSPR